MAATGTRDIIQLLANPTNRTILSVLSMEPQYPRRLAEIVGLTEDEASRRLRSFEKVGLAVGSWANVGRNVRLYQISNSRFTVSVDAAGVSVSGLRGEKPVLLGSAAETPPSTERFVGREEEIEGLAAGLFGRKAVCLTGIGGTGKTLIAAALARRLARPILWHTLAPGESFTLLLGRLAANQRALDAGERGQRLMSLGEAEDESVLVSALLDSINALRCVVVLDRFEVAGEGAAELVATLARGLTEGQLVLTSRNFPAGVPRDEVPNHRVHGLSREDANLVLARFGRAPDADALNEIYDRTHGHPLSLVLLAQVADDRREASVARLMAESGIRDFLLDDVVPQLPESERELLYALAILRLPFTLEEAEAVSASRHARHLLLRLEGRGLVSRAGDTFLLHDLVRSFVAEAAPNPAQAHQRAAKALRASGEPAKVLEAIHHWIEGGMATEAGQLIREEATRHLYRFADHGLGAPYREILERLAPRLVEPKSRAVVELELGVLATFGGDAEEAERRLGGAEAAGGRVGELHLPLLAARARLERLQGNLEAAAKHYEEAERLAAKAGDLPRRLELLVDAAFLAEERDDDVAFELYEKAAELARGTDDIRCLSLAYAGASRIRLRGGDSGFLPMAQEALKLARLTGYLRGEVSVYMTLTTHAMVTGETKTGLEYSDRYVEIANRLGDPWLHACAINDRAMLFISSARYDDGLALAKEAIHHARAIRSVFFEFGARLCEAEALIGLGRPAEAIPVLEEAMKLRVEAWPLFIGRGWEAMAVAQEAVGRKKEAAASRLKAKAFFARPGRPNISLDVIHFRGAALAKKIDAEPVAAPARPRKVAKPPRPRR